MAKTIQEINDKIKQGNAVVVTAEEIIGIVAEEGIEAAAKKVDVVTTGTFSAMCSTGAFLNFGHAEPLIRMTKVKLNGVPAYAGLAAVDAFIGATELKDNGDMTYGGAHVIQDLIDGKEVVLEAESYGTDCYPRKHIKTVVTLNDLNQAYLYNPRNLYQNYPAACNTTDNTIYTYMGRLLPQIGNINYATAGELSPLLNDPQLRTIGIGTRIFIGGAQGYVSGEGTQYKTGQENITEDVVRYAGRTLAVTGDLRQMNTRFIRAASYEKYGVSMFMGIGVPIPIIDEEMLRFVSVKNCDIYTYIEDYSVPRRTRPVLGRVSYEELRSGSVTVNGKKVQTAPMSSLAKAREIAAELKAWIEKGEFLLTEPVASLPTERVTNPLKEIDEV
jgi:uncharacterized protein (DUF39 family)